MDSNQIVTLNPQIKVITKANVYKCSFCHKSDINHIEWGPMCQLEDLVVHYFCMLFSSALRQNGKDTEGILGFLPVDLKKEIRRGDKLKCKFCKKKGATLGCAIKSCKTSFHFSCGIPNGTLNQFSGSFSSFCAVHKPKIIIPVDPSNWDCEVCILKVKQHENVVWPPCCKKRVFHKLCIQNYAATAGYFFSCPCCKDKTNFIKAMKDSGVYVPEQDAAWELEQGAFSDLNQRYSQCDAEECLCPRGRKYESPRHRSWKIVRCGSCGSSATHYSCGQLDRISWRCPPCLSVLVRHPSDYRMIRLEGEEVYSSDEYTSDDDSGSTETDTDENCRVQIASRSALVGVEREAKNIETATDRIKGSSKTIVNSDHEEETVEDREARKKREREEQNIVYNRTLKKKFRVELCNEDSDSSDGDIKRTRRADFATRKTRLVSDYFQDYVNVNLVCGSSEDVTVFKADVRAFHDKLANLRFISGLQKKMRAISGSIHLTQARPTDIERVVKDPNLKALSRVKNLDISEHEGNSLHKFISMPDIAIPLITSEVSKSRDIISPCKSNVSDPAMGALSLVDSTTSQVVATPAWLRFQKQSSASKDSEPSCSEAIPVSDNVSSPDIADVVLSHDSAEEDIKIIEAPIKPSNPIEVIDIDETQANISPLQPARNAKKNVASSDDDLVIVAEKIAPKKTCSPLQPQEKIMAPTGTCIIKSAAFKEALIEKKVFTDEIITLSDSDENDFDLSKSNKRKTVGSGQKTSDEDVVLLNVQNNEEGRARTCKRKSEEELNPVTSKKSCGGTTPSTTSHYFDFSTSSRSRNGYFQNLSNSKRGSFSIDFKR